MNKFDSIVLGGLEIAQTEAIKRRHAALDKYHLLYGLTQVKNSRTRQIFKPHIAFIEDKLKGLPQLANKPSIDQLRPGPELQELLTFASGDAAQEGREEVREQDILKHLSQFFPEIQFNEKDIKLEGEEEVPHFLINLNELAKNGKLDPVIGRKNEIRAVMEILGRRGKNNPILIGEAGVGKNAIIEGLAEQIVKDNVPDVLKGKEIYSLDLGQLMAGTKFRGEFEERLQSLLKFMKDQDGQAILFIDEIHQLVGAGKTEGAMDAANLLKPALARGEIHCVGATTPEEYQKYLLGDNALDRRFRTVWVEEPLKEDAIEILMGLKDKFEIHHGIKISDDAIFKSVYLSGQYMTDKKLPDKAIDLIDESASALKLSAEAMPLELVKVESELRTKKVLLQVEPDNQEVKDSIKILEQSFATGKKEWESNVLELKKMSQLKNERDRLKYDLEQAERTQNYELASQIKYSLLPEVEEKIENVSHDWILSGDHIASTVSRRTGIPLEKIQQSKQDHILKLNNFLNSRVFGQEVATKEISETLEASHAGLTDPTRPLGSFLLMGPTGVGKTETAKALAEFLFGTEDHMTRFDLSEFSESHSIAKLIGAPAGYIGHEDGGVLTEAVRKRPYQIILFDEIEKAHRDFGDLLLQILDDGRLTDNKGRVIDFKNTIIMITTNSKNPESDFRPEVLGRLDAVIHYRSLDQGIMERLIQKQVDLLNQRLAQKKISISLESELMNYLSKKGYDPTYGARPLQRVFQSEIIRPLSKRLLQGSLESGKLEISRLEGGKLEFLT